jgi:hypothetical protein
MVGLSAPPQEVSMQVDELLKPFPIKEFHPFPRAMLGPGAHEMIGPEALKLGFGKTLVMTTGYYENAPVIKGDTDDIDRITRHVLGDACTPGNAKECTFETVRPVVEHAMTGDLDDLLS